MPLYASFLRLRLHNGYSFVNGRLCMSQTDEKQGSRMYTHSTKFIWWSVLTTSSLPVRATGTRARGGNKTFPSFLIPISLIKSC